MLHFFGHFRGQGDFRVIITVNPECSSHFTSSIIWCPKSYYPSFLPEMAFKNYKNPIFHYITVISDLTGQQGVTETKSPNSSQWVLQYVT